MRQKPANLRVLIRSIVSGKTSKEDKDALIDQAVAIILDHSQTKFRKVGARDLLVFGGSLLSSALGPTISVCMDIYGAEVLLLNGRELLDCEPAYYNLTKDQAMKLHDAICKRAYNRTIEEERA